MNNKTDKLILKIFLTILVFTLLFVSCVPSENGSNSNIIEGATNLYREIDEDAGVVCWIYSGYQSGGIDCMPISETLLDD